MSSVLSKSELENLNTTVKDAKAVRLDSSSNIFRSYVLNEIDFAKICVAALRNSAPAEEPAPSPTTKPDQLPPTPAVEKDLETQEKQPGPPTGGGENMDNTSKNFNPRSPPKLNTLRQKILKIVSDRSYSPDQFSQKIWDLIANYRRKRILAKQDRVLERPNRTLLGGNLKRRKDRKNNKLEWGQRGQPKQNRPEIETNEEKGEEKQKEDEKNKPVKEKRKKKEKKKRKK